MKPLKANEIGIHGEKQDQHATLSDNPLTSFITCSACSGHGTYWKPSLTFSQPILAKCQPCEGTGQVLICTNCGAKLAYGRLGRSCGCNAVALNLAKVA